MRTLLRTTQLQEAESAQQELSLLPKPPQERVLIPRQTATAAQPAVEARSQSQHDTIELAVTESEVTAVLAACLGLGPFLLASSSVVPHNCMVYRDIGSIVLMKGHRIPQLV